MIRVRFGFDLSSDRQVPRYLIASSPRDLLQYALGHGFLGVALKVAENCSFVCLFVFAEGHGLLVDLSQITLNQT